MGIYLDQGEGLFACGPAGANVSPKPHNLLPHLNPDWFYCSGY